MTDVVSVIEDVDEQGSTFVGVVPRGTPAPQDVQKLTVLLIKPSKYDDEGYVLRYLRGVLPSNTLATLAGLTQEVIEERQLGNVDIEIVMMDEFVQKIDPRKLARKYLKPGQRAVAALCGVQTNQFPRAADLARALKAAGIPAMIGGFHVSGAIALGEGIMPPEIQALLDEGITVVKGEVEECWGDLLRDALHGRLRTYYNIEKRPELTHANIPVVEPRLMKRFAYPYMATIDAGRGCPFGCTFCTIINVQGRRMRCRSAEKIKDRIRRNAALKIDYYFFTDDNFARNPNWSEILDAMIDLRQNEGIQFQFMMQVDVLAYRIPGFMTKAAEAGCSQVFIGMESINPANLADAGKRQNKVEDFRHMIDEWHAAGIACHVGYIIGFPHDTPESVREDVRRLRDEIGVDQASFFMLTPLPGSQDHVEMVKRGEWMEPDYNKYDSFHAAATHPRMSGAEWFETYKQAWCDFYTTDGMKAVLARANNWTYWGLFKNFMWYKYAALIERNHPMICGFFPLKDRKNRRPGCAIDPWPVHLRKRAGEVGHVVRESVKLFFELQEVWLATRGRLQIKANLDELKRRMDEMRVNAGEALSRGAASVRASASEAAASAGEALSRSATSAGEALSRGAASVRASASEAATKAGEAFSRSTAGVRASANEAATRAGEAFSRSTAGVRASAGEAFTRAQSAGRQAADDISQRFDQICQQHAPRLSWMRRLTGKLNPFAVKTQTRTHLNDYWRQTWAKLKRGHVFQINPFQLTLNALRDAKLCMLFSFSFIFGYGK